MDTNETIRVGVSYRGRDDLIHREILQIGVLILIAVVGFFITRAVAADNRDVSFRDAEAWYEHGQQLMSVGRVEEAIASLRRASVRNRSERKYVLALASAFEHSGDTEAARAALLTLREASPEDSEVNLTLARLAAQRLDVTEALRFYHNSLYAPWPRESARDRREVRFELIEFLLRHDQGGRALSELLAMSADLPNDAGVNVRVAQLFARAGDARQALEHYERALRLAPNDREALAGAGTSAFAFGDYIRARTYLRRIPDDGDDVAPTRQIVEVVLSGDPPHSHVESGRSNDADASLNRSTMSSSGCGTAGRVMPAYPNATRIRRSRERLGISAAS
jgi:tetratricopeptide (TPR) repeat protein